LSNPFGIELDIALKVGMRMNRRVDGIGAPMD